MKITEPLNVLIIERDIDYIKNIQIALKCCNDFAGNSLVREVYSEASLSDGKRLIECIEIDTVIIDPIEMGLEIATQFIFNIRKALPNIVFILYCNSDKVKEIEREYYQGERSRFHHYYRINKKSKNDKLKGKIYHAIHLCLAEIRLRKYCGKTLKKTSFIPYELMNSLEEYNHKFPKKQKTAFIMMRFDDNNANKDIYNTIKYTLIRFGIHAVRADEYQFSRSLLNNIQTCMHGCDFGIAVFDRITHDDFNPNVSYEIGYMMALNKPLCILKDQGLKALQTDLVGELYNEFNSHEAVQTVDNAITKWIERNEIAEIERSEVVEIA